MYQNNRLRTSTPVRKRRSARWPAIIMAVVLLAVIGLGGYLLVGPKAKQQSTTNDKQAAPQFDKTRLSLSDPASIWVIANKQRPLSPKQYAPVDLRAPNIPLRRGAADPEMQIRDEAATALEKLVAAANIEDSNLMLASGYRSYEVQSTVYNSEVRGYGQAVADQESARPGHSEHQTGLALDLEPTSRKCEIADCFADTPEGKWLAANAYTYGFIIRYTPDKVAVTGYKYEPWHIRYIGTDLAAEMHRQNVKTLEEFFGLPAVPNY